MTDRHRRVATLMEERKLGSILYFGTGQFSTDNYWLTDWPGGDGRRAHFSPLWRPLRLLDGVWYMPRLGELKLAFADKIADFCVVDKDRVRNT